VGLPAELATPERRRVVNVADLSRSGMFLQLERPIPAGTLVHVTITVEGQRRATAATVAHVLPEPEARVLGREPGLGIAFREPIGLTDELFRIAVERVIRDVRTAPRCEGHIVIADPQTRLLERMSSALSEIGFTVATATSAIDALAACLHQRPDIVLIDRAMAVTEGLPFLDQLANHPTLAGIPAIMTSNDRSDVVMAFEHGAADFLGKPFTSPELIARTCRLVHPSPPPRDPIALRGSLSTIGLPGLLTMLEQEGTSGRLTIAGEDHAWIDLAAGRIVGAGSGPHADPHAAVMRVLGWTQGTFELTSCVPRRTKLLLPIMHLLLEHACRQDEAAQVAVVHSRA